MSKKSLSLLALLFAGTLPLYFVWTCDYLPFADFPNHIARINILKLYNTSEFYRSYFTVSYFNGLLPTPNIIFDIFAVKLFPFLPEEVAGKMFLSLYVALSMASVLFLAEETGADGELALLGYLPALYGFFFNMAFLNFIFSIPLIVFALAVFLKYEKDGRSFYLLILAGLAVLIYLSHIFSFCVLVLLLLFSLALRKMKRKIVLFAASAVSLAVVFAFLSSVRFDMKYYPLGLRYKFHLLPLYFISYPVNYFDYGLSMVVLLLYCVGLLWLVATAPVRDRKLAIMGLLFLVIYLVLPFSAIGTLVDARALPFFVLLVLMSVGRSEKSRRAVPAIIFVIVILLKAYGSFSYYSAYSEDVPKVMSCMDRVERGAVILPVCSMEQSNINPYIHLWGYEVLKKEIIAPYLFAGRQTPLQFRRELFAPSGLWGYQGSYDESPSFWDRLRNTYDYILVIGDNKGLIPLLEPIGREICNTGTASLYRVSGGRER